MPKETHNFNCAKCNAVDDSHMVQCDHCDKWFHYGCVGVDDKIADVSWNCENCAESALQRRSTTAQSPRDLPIAESLAHIQGTVPNVENPGTSKSFATLPATFITTCLATRPTAHSTIADSQHVASAGIDQLNFSNISQQHIANAGCHKVSLSNFSPQHVYSGLSQQQSCSFNNQQMFSGICQPNVASRACQYKCDDVCPKLTHSDVRQPHSLNKVECHSHDCMSRSLPNVLNVTSSTSQSHPVYNGEHQLYNSTTEPSMMQHLQRDQNLFVNNFQRNNFDQINIDQNHNNIRATNRWRQVGPTPAQIAARHVIPKDLPHFHGDPEEWPLFISSFENSTSIAGYTDAENLIRLQACLKGRAREMVKSRLLVPAMIPEVIQTLRMCFGRPEFIIETLIEKSRKIPPVKDRLETLIDLALCIRNIYATMESCHMGAYMNNPMLIKEWVEKLPNQYKLSWATHPKDNRVPIVKVFSDWIYNFAEAASQVVSPQTSKRNGFINTHFQATLETDRRDARACVYCKSHEHRITQCQKFRDLAVDSRWEFVRTGKLCRQCLNIHRRRCLSKRLCSIRGCTAKHNQLLHKEMVAPVHPNGDQALNSHITKECKQNFFRIIPVCIYNANICLKTFAFLDEGSSVTLIDRKMIDLLNLKGVNDPLCLRWTGDQKRTEDSSIRTTLQVSNVRGGQCFTLKSVRTVEKLGLPSQSVSITELIQQFPHLKGLPIEGYENARPTILIGSDNWNLAIPLKVKEGKWCEPIATKTRLGWTIQGGHAEQSSSALNIHACDCGADLQKLHELVKDNFQMESPVKASIMSEEAQRAIHILNETCKKTGNAYEVGLLWRSDDVDLPDSYSMAYNRLLCLQKKFKRDPGLRMVLQNKIDHLVEKGYAVKLDDEEALSTKGNVWYLPIFITLNPNKPGKVRLVWDAAAKTAGVSLNDFMLSGPDLLNSLVEVLLGFRIGRIAICGDIEEMFHQIRVRETDAHAQRFLWWDQQNEKATTYVMRSLSFGITCAPCIAHYVRNKNADDNSQQYPRAAWAIKNAHYMDDYIDSGDNEENVLELAKDVKTVHAAAGFNIRNWVSNSTRVASELEGVRCTTQTSVHLGSSEKILGVYWDPNRDVFKYEFKFVKLKRAILTEDLNPTKREILQVLMSMFDPLGFLSIYTVELKMLLQDVWRAGIDWDEELSTPLLAKWNQWKATIPKITRVEIPRCFSVHLYQATDVQLHTFVDAGEYAYAAVTYLRVQLGENVSISIVAAKSKVAPLKPVSIPRMELQAALIGTRLATQVLNTSRIKVSSKIFWTDSLTVLKWLRMDPRGLKQFVMFRVAEVLECTNVAEWRWVPSKLNPADLATKTESKVINDAWFSGPPFLLNPADSWPKREDFGPADTTETKAHVIGFHRSTEIANINTEYFSNWRRLYRSLATFLLYLARLKANISRQVLPDKLTYELILRAKNQLLRIAQSSEFHQEVRRLQEGKPIDKNSKLISLAVYLDDTTILRVKSRAELLMVRDVIVLPYDHHVTFLIIRDIHEKYHHVCQEAVVNAIKGKFYIPRLRVLHKKVRRLCQYCANRDARPIAPQMAQLPKARLAVFERPFTFVGIDYFGPIYVAVGRRREKRWGVIFTCLTVRAVHIEVAHSLDTDSCVLSMRNFISRRGTPREIYTDNGTNFTATSKVLETEAINYDGLRIKYDDLKWNFNPPAAPHMGGAWERLVRSIKEVLKNMQPSSAFNDETLRSSLTEIEFIINSRPLTFVSIDSSDDEAITPNHLLLGSACGFKPIGNQQDTLKRRYCMTRSYVDQFWRRWIREYSPTLTRRSKWFVKQPPLKPGDVVIIVDENLPRNSWPKGIVARTITAKDGQVRRAVVKTSHGIVERPTAKLAVLDVGTQVGNLIDSDYKGENVAAIVS